MFDWTKSRWAQEMTDSLNAHAEAMFAGIDAGISREGIEFHPRFQAARQAAFDAIRDLPNEPDWGVVLTAARRAAAKEWAKEEIP